MNYKRKRRWICISSRALFLSVGAAWLVAGFCGCATMQRPAVADARLQEDLSGLREDIARARGRMETVEMEYDRLLREMKQLRNTVSMVGGERDDLSRRIDKLERGLSELNAARGKDRELIVDQLSSRVADMIAETAAGGRRARLSGTGYEHVIRAGETLSQIAAAYKVKPSVIIEANDLKDPDMLRQGQTLFIPE